MELEFIELKFQKKRHYRALYRALKRHYRTLYGAIKLKKTCMF